MKNQKIYELLHEKNNHWVEILDLQFQSNQTYSKICGICDQHANLPLFIENEPMVDI
jgi:ATP-dependent 26S proteasome regulatory subunit